MMVELEKQRHLQKVMALPEEKDGSNALASGKSEASNRAARGSRIVERGEERWGRLERRLCRTVGRREWELFDLL